VLPLMSAYRRRSPFGPKASEWDWVEEEWGVDLGEDGDRIIEDECEDVGCLCVWAGCRATMI
jgi:hypothetical protein